MSYRYRIDHTLSFLYDAPVRESIMKLFVTPGRTLNQALHELKIETTPAGPVFEFDDPFGNRGHFFDRHASHRSLEIRIRSRVEITRPAPLPPTPPIRPDRTGPDTPERQLMLLPSRFARSSPALEDFIARQGIERPPNDGIVEGVRELCATLARVFVYAPGTTDARSPIEHILETGRGVCQDYAHVMIAIARQWRLPARYVSGYLGAREDDPEDGQSHAWVEIWIPGFGWHGFDPANNCECDERHIRVAVGRDYLDVPPVRGTFRGDATSDLSAEVQVIPDPDR